MRSFEFESWDGGRLTVNREFAALLRRQGLTRFDLLMDRDRGSVAKDLRDYRVTARIELDDGGRRRALYIKRHGPSPWKEYVKPLLHGQRPIVGARNEWNALLRFHALGLPTMVPVALGECGRSSFLLTESIDGCRKLSEWSASPAGGEAPDWPARLRRIAANVAATARTMHRAGLHHQDFYLGHLLVPDEDDARTVYVIDLGRVRWRRTLSQRWIVKDLAQLNYSARGVCVSERLRFLRHYLDRPLSASDRPLIRRILRKTAAIARHSRKNRL